MGRIQEWAEVEERLMELVEAVKREIEAMVLGRKGLVHTKRWWTEKLAKK